MITWRNKNSNAQLEGGKMDLITLESDLEVASKFDNAYTLTRFYFWGWLIREKLMFKEACTKMFISELFVNFTRLRKPNFLTVEQWKNTW